MRLRLAAIALFAIFSIIYLPALGRGFVKDDYRWIEESRVHAPADLGRLFTANVGFYRPLVAATFAADYALWGLNPRGYAATNVILLLADAVLLFLLVRRFSLPPPAALLAVAVWAFNFHGVNMALLWTSGRTALLLCLCGVASALAFLGGHRLAAALLAGAAMLCKEEAAILPALLLAFDLSDRRAARSFWRVVARSWPMWTALVVYAALRIHSGAFGPLDAPDYYRFTFTPRVLLRNVVEYLDRAVTGAAIVAVILTVGVRTRNGIDDDGRRAVRFGAMWFVAFYAITVFLPVRSSLYAVAPAMGSALAVAALAARAWREDPQRFGRIVAALVAATALLVPVYRSRNTGFIGPSDLAAGSLTVIRSEARPWLDEAGVVTAIDHPGEPVTLNDAFGALFPSAVHLFVGDHWTGEIVSARPSVQIGRHDLVFELHNGSLIRATSDNR